MVSLAIFVIKRARAFLSLFRALICSYDVVFWMCGWKNGSGVVRNTQKTEFLGFPKFFDVFSQKNWVRHGQEQIQKNLKKKLNFFLKISS